MRKPFMPDMADCDWNNILIAMDKAYKPKSVLKEWQRAKEKGGWGNVDTGMFLRSAVGVNWCMRFLKKALQHTDIVRKSQRMTNYLDETPAFTYKHNSRYKTDIMVGLSYFHTCGDKTMSLWYISNQDMKRFGI